MFPDKVISKFYPVQTWLSDQVSQPGIQLGALSGVGVLSLRDPDSQGQEGTRE